MTMANFLNLMAKERNVHLAIRTYGLLYGEGAYVLATSNYRLPTHKAPRKPDALTYKEADSELMGPVRFAEAEARYHFDGTRYARGWIRL